MEPWASTSRVTLGAFRPRSCCQLNRAQTAGFHTSAYSAIQTKRTPKAVVQANSKRIQAMKFQRKQELASTRPDPVFGFSPGNQALWENCDLRKILLDREEVWGITDKSTEGRSSPVEMAKAKDATEHAPADQPYRPQYLNWGLNEANVLLLSEQLPRVSAQRAGILNRVNGRVAKSLEGHVSEDKVVMDENNKVDQLMRIVDLRNAGSKGIWSANVQRIIKTFGRGQDDCGSPEVQIALLTARLRIIVEHLERNPKEQLGKRMLNRLVQQRIRIFRYLRRVSADRYVSTLARCGIEQRAVEARVEII